MDYQRLLVYKSNCSIIYRKSIYNWILNLQIFDYDEIFKLKLLNKCFVEKSFFFLKSLSSVSSFYFFNDTNIKRFIKL